MLGFLLQNGMYNYIYTRMLELYLLTLTKINDIFYETDPFV